MLQTLSPIAALFGSSHELKVRRFFGRQYAVPQNGDTIDTPLNILVFVNRSGSTLISQYLQATGSFSEFGEPLSHAYVVERSREMSLPSFSSYLRAIYSELAGPGVQVGIKASLVQVQMLLRSGAIPNLFTDVRWIFVQRLDVLSQAISLSIAQQTNSWYSTESGGNAAPRYDYRDIYRRTRSISRTYANILRLLSSYDITPYHVTYEQFVAGPDATTRELAAFLGAGEVNVDSGKLTLEKQANAVSEEFRRRFIEEFDRGFRRRLF